jgi:hypothetical protein
MTEDADEDPAPAAWFEDDSFWKASFPCLFPDEKFASAEEQVSQLPKLVGSPFFRVLDLCCGPGRHAIALARACCEMVSPAGCWRCRAAE